MKNILIIFTLLALISGCKPDNKKIVEGDLYFVLIDFHRFYHDAPDSTIAKIETNLKTINRDTLVAQDRVIYDWCKLLSENKLWRKPLVKLRQDNGKIIVLFLDSTDYKQVKDYNYSNLVDNGKKVRVSAEVVELKQDTLAAYKTLKIISINKLNGETYWHK